MKNIPEKYQLSAKEIECLKLSAHRSTAKEIAKEFSISYRTVEKHFENIRLKIGINKITSIIHKAQGLGII